MYREIRDVIIKAHCDYKTADGDPDAQHQCLGAITFRAESVVLKCPLCGACKGLHTDA